ncbi:Leucine carboxyl methyltransferase 1 [Nakaseomyces bracarensis]|uniref:Leucine carboxyl methyltransferase 1 n=1 Tax=Nakaseomyces bracarensis TaxID=273131 RepID=A0ABR4NTS6_9SACH
MERAIQQTDFDALASKISAVSTKYLPPVSTSRTGAGAGYDILAQLYMAYLEALRGVSRRAFGKCKYSGNSYPVMNYGTYLRTLAIDERVFQFVERNGDGPLQIVNIGCGSDLRMVPLLRHTGHDTQFQSQGPAIRYVDLDYMESVKLKRDTLEKSPVLSSMLQDERYVLESCDLRDIEATKELLLRLTDPKVPTLIISECVLCYLPEKESQSLIDCIIDTYTEGEWVSYDPIGGSAQNDRFGVIMQQNLRESRQLEMPTLLKFNSCATYASRWTQRNNSVFKSEIMDMWQYYNDSVSPQEKNRLKTLQFMDEVEELKIMQSHYVTFYCQWKD